MYVCPLPPYVLETSVLPPFKNTALVLGVVYGVWVNVTLCVYRRCMTYIHIHSWPSTSTTVPFVSRGKQRTHGNGYSVQASMLWGATT